MKKSLLLLFFTASLSFYAHSQTLHLKVDHCNTLQLSIDDLSSDEFSVLLEKEFQKGIWVKQGAYVGEDAKINWTNISNGSYRTTLIYNAEFTYSNIVDVKCRSNDVQTYSELNVILSPNPVINTMNVDIGIDPMGEVYTVEILDFNGKLVRTIDLTERVTNFSVGDAPHGLYLFNLYQNKELKNTSKFIISKN